MDSPVHTSFWLIEISADLSVLEDQLKHIEEQAEQWRQDAEDIRDTMLENLASLSQNDRQPWSQFAHEIHEDYVECRLPYILHNPLLISIYTVYESAVTRIASLIQKKKGQELSLNDYEKKGFLKRAKRYYQDVLEFNLSRDNQSWERLTILAELRHAIAHANGHLEMVKESRRKRIRKWIEREIGIEDHYGDITVSQAFVRETFEMVKHDLEDLLERCSKLDKEGRGLPQANQS